MGLFRKAASPAANPKLKPSPRPEYKRFGNLNLNSRTSLSDSASNSPLESPDQPLLSIQPLALPVYEDVPMWNILPSYQLYELTFSKNLDPLSDVVCGCPPLYEATSPPASTSSQTDYFGVATQSNRWENTILGNTHRLTQLLLFNSALADQLKVDVRLTSGAGRRGVKPQFYDGQDYEFLQGDLIHGHVTFLNVSKDPLPFDMVSVVFEGRVSVNGEDAAGNKKPVVFYKFLNMFDYRALWTPAYFDDSISEADLVDPTDGSVLMLPAERYFEPGVKYKKFFNFTIPEKLLECACEVHELDGHCNLLPLIGLDKEQFLQNLRKLREKPQKANFILDLGESEHAKSEKPQKSKKPQQKRIRAKDFLFPDTAISYCVEARVVGKLSEYGGTESKDEFIMVKESSAPIRMIPKTLESADFEQNAEEYFRKFVQNVQQCIATGERLENGGNPQQVNRSNSVVKNKQLYINLPDGSCVSSSLPSTIESYMPYKKKFLAQAPKVVGMISASTLKRAYVLQYTPSASCRPISERTTGLSTKMNFPLTLTYSSHDPKNLKPPEIKSLNADIVACTIRSKKYPIPVELATSLVVGNSPGQDGFEKNVTQPFSRYVKEIATLSEKYEPSQLDLTAQNIMDIKSLANLGIKHNNLKIDDFSYKTVGGLGQWKEKNGKFQKFFDISLDIKSLLSKEKHLLDELVSLPVCLVPTFQSCIVCRFYYVTVNVKFAANETMALKIAVKIEN